jgi:hypothetical protein
VPQSAADGSWFSLISSELRSHFLGQHAQIHREGLYEISFGGTAVSRRNDSTNEYRPLSRSLSEPAGYDQGVAGCDGRVSYDVAYEAGNPMAMLAAIELRAKLCRFLTEQVEHRQGLDDASTETLLAMTREIENQKRKCRQLIEKSAFRESKPVS